MTRGEALKKSLGLQKFTYITIQKVINAAIPIFVLTMDSRHPTVYISYSKILKIKSMTIQKILAFHPNTLTSDADFKVKKVKMTPPMDLESFDRIIPQRSIIFCRDLSGEWYKNRSLYENKTDYDVRFI